ncbi:MAG TPA: hypothetical protein VFP44_15880 [Usitatibacter sp.]|nr:hypothetical protein [Usitatibacter sp.]
MRSLLAALLLSIASTAALAVSTDTLYAPPEPTAKAGDVRPMPVRQAVGGHTQSDLSVRWWQWAASFQYRDSPVADRTGERCGAKQQGDVWFLAGTYGSAATSRTCRMPAGKHVFFPLINYVVMPSSCEGCLTCERAAAKAQQMTDDAMGLFAELDGRSLESLRDHRVASGRCFDLAERAGGPVKIEPTASNGYWLLLPPLAKGPHTLRFGGSLPSLRQELIYTLIVE